MATGTGNLPYITDPVSPFDTILAETTNEHIANIEAVADGTGIGDGSVTTNALADGAVTPEKRSGGFAVGSFVCPSSTGNHSVTGIGFTPKKLTFVAMITNGSSIQAQSNLGVATASAQWAVAAASRSGGIHTRPPSTSHCIVILGVNAGGAATTDLLASLASIDADGFTVNFTTSSNAYTVLWTAEA